MTEGKDRFESIGSDAAHELKGGDDKRHRTEDKRDESSDKQLEQLNEERPRIYKLGRWLITSLVILIVASVVYGLLYKYDRYVHIAFISAGFIFIATIMGSLVYGVNHKRQNTNTDVNTLTRLISELIKKNAE